MIDALGQPQCVLVIGGGSDIAAAVVDRWVDLRTDTVILAGRNFKEMETVQSKLQAHSSVKVEISYLDLTDHSSIEPFVNDAFDRFPDIDLVLLAAGQLGDQAEDEISPSRVEAMFDTNATGTAITLTAVANRLRLLGSGAIVVLSSVAGERVRRSNYVYGSTKAALDGFSLGLADSLIGSGVRLVLIRPGFVKTKMTTHLANAPLATTPDRVAGDIVAALAKGRLLTWSPGAMRWVMLIYKHIPRSIARKLPF